MSLQQGTDAWRIVEHEKQRDRTLRRISIAAWVATFIVVAAFAVIVAVRVYYNMKLAAAGAVMPWQAVEAAMPLIVVLGALSLLIAVLATVGVFFRLRTASLAEIQLRLAALEGVLAREGSARV